MATVDRDQSSRTRQVFFYFGPMTLLVYLVMPHVLTVPLAFVHSANTALLLAMPIGLLGSWNTQLEAQVLAEIGVTE